MSTFVRISDMAPASVPYAGTPLFEVSIPVGAGDYDTYRTSLDDLASSILGAAYVILTPTTGQTVSIPSGFSKVILNPAGVLATLSLQLPVGIDKQAIRIATRRRIDALTLLTPGSVGVDWPVGELPQYGILDLTLIASLNTWVRI